MSRFPVSYVTYIYISKTQISLGASYNITTAFLGIRKLSMLHKSLGVRRNSTSSTVTLTMGCMKMGKVQIFCLADSANTREYIMGSSWWVEVEDEEVSIQTGYLDLWIYKRLQHCQRDLTSICLRQSMELLIREEGWSWGEWHSYMPFPIGMYFLLMVLYMIPFLIFL